MATNYGRWSKLAYKDYRANPQNYTFSITGPSITEQYMMSKNGLGISKINNPFSRGNIGSTALSVAPVVIGAADKALNKGVSNTTGNVLSGIGGGLMAIPSPYTQAAGAVLMGAGFIANGLTDRVNTGYQKAKHSEINSLGNTVSTATNFADLDAEKRNWGTVDIGDLDNWGDIGFLSSGSKVKRARNDAMESLLVAQNTRAGNWTSRANGINFSNTMNQLGRLSAYGGFLDSVDPSTAIGYAMFTDKYVKDKSKGATGVTPVPNFQAFGGDLQTMGADFPTGLVHIGTGNTHEQNPYGGVQVGTDQEGTPNLVEEGETIYDDYVFSDRLIVPRGMRGNYGKRNKYAKGGKLNKGNSDGQQVPYEQEALKPFEGLTFADAAKKAEKLSGADERPTDPIAQRGLQAMLQVLAGTQEKEREKEKLQEMKDAIDNMTPEEFVMFQQQMEQQQEQIPQGMEQLNPQQIEQPISALGGILSKSFAYGGDLAQFSKDLGKLGLSIDDYLAYWNSANGIQNTEGTTLTDSNFNKDEAEKFLTSARKLKRVYSKKVDIDGLGRHGRIQFASDLRKVMANPELLNSDNDGNLAITNYRPASGNRAERTEGFNRYSVQRDQESFFGNPIQATDGKWNIQYPTPANPPEGYTPNGLTPIENMWHYDSEHNQWLDKDNNVVSNPFGEETLFDNVITGQSQDQFANQDELSQYYRDKITERFKALKGDQYDQNRLPRYFLSKDELSSWIDDLQASDDAKDKSLATMLQANWNLEGDNFVESDSYLGLDETKDKPLQRDKKPGIEHIPYMSAVQPSASRYELLNPDGSRMDETNRVYVQNPTGNPLYTVRDTPLDVQGGVSTYGVIGGNVSPDLVYNNGKFYNITPEQAQLIAANKVADPTTLEGWKGYADPYLGYSVSPNVYNISGNDDAWKTLGFIGDEPLDNNGLNTNGDPFPKAPSWPYLLGAGLQLGSLGYNILSPADYSNADAMISAAKEAGTFTPIGAMFAGQQLPYKPAADTLWGKLQDQTQGNARNIINNSRGNLGATIAGLLGNTYAGNIALGDAHEKWRQGNWNMLKDVQTFGLQRDTSNYDRLLKAEMSNQDAESRARGYKLEGLKSGYAMRQAIDDAKANAINAGLTGLGTTLFNYAQNKYNQDMLGWGIRNGAYAPQAVRANGGRIRRYKGLTF